MPSERDVPTLDAMTEAMARAYCRLRGIDPDGRSSSDPAEGHEVDGCFEPSLYDESGTRPWRYAWRMYRIEGAVLARAALALLGDQPDAALSDRDGADRAGA